MDRSLSISASEKPLSKRRESTNRLDFFWLEFVMPVEALSTSAILAGSRPKRWPTSSAATPMRHPPALTSLLSAFIACPAPGGPHRWIVVPTARSTGSARSRSSGSPPAMMPSSPGVARATPPLTGQSAIATPRAARRAAISRVRCGAPLVMSTTSAPAASEGSAAAQTCATSLEIGTTVTSTAAPAHASAGVSRARAESSSAKRAARPGAASHAASSWPARARLAAIGQPMLPRPAKASRIGPAAEILRRARNEGREGIVRCRRLIPTRLAFDRWK